MEDDLGRSMPRDTFIYLLATICLYASVCALLTILFQFVNLAFPDPLGSEDSAGYIRVALSVVVIIFPVYVWATRFLERDLTDHPAKFRLWLRRWLIALTLFLAGSLMIVVLVVVVYNFIDGELTIRFVLKALSILIVAGAIATFYRGLYQRTEGPSSQALRTLGYASAAVVGVIIIVAFFLVGSPQRERLAGFDRQKISDLSYIQSEVVSYWRHKKTLPASLGELNDVLSNVKVPTDPQSHASYAYRKTGSLTFELCADFNLPRGPTQPNPSPWSWEPTGFERSAGHVCFTRTIDPARDARPRD